MFIHIIDAFSEDVSEGDRRKYVIKLFGATGDGAQVQVDVTGFRPFLFVGMPQGICKKKLMNEIERLAKDALKVL